MNSQFTGKYRLRVIKNNWFRSDISFFVHRSSFNMTPDETVRSGNAESIFIQRIGTYILGAKNTKFL